MDDSEFHMVVGDEIDVAGEVSRIISIEDDPLLGRVVTLINATPAACRAAAPLIIRMDLLRAVVDAFVNVTMVSINAETIVA